MPKKREIPDQKAYLVISSWGAKVTEDVVYVIPRHMKSKRGPYSYHIFRDCETLVLFETEPPYMEPASSLERKGFVLCKKCETRKRENGSS